MNTRSNEPGSVGMISRALPVRISILCCMPAAATASFTMGVSSSLMSMVVSRPSGANPSARQMAL